MPKVGLSAVLIVAFSVSSVVSGQEIAIDKSRPLFVLCRELRGRYGLLVTYEDGPVDRDSELYSETRPNGLRVFGPMWRPIIFRLPSDLPVRDQTIAFAPVTIDPAQALAAVQEVVKQYNESGNPGRFTVVPDGAYLHIVQTQRNIGGKLQAFEPITNTAVSIDRTHRPCYVVLGDLLAQIRQLRAVSIVEGVVPTNGLFSHSCSIGEGSVTARQVLVDVLDSLGVSRFSGQKNVSYSWTLVHEPNDNKYFLNIIPVQVHQPLPPADAPQPIPDSTGSDAGGRLRYRPGKSNN